ncbi:hypothetical protein BCY90_04750 [Agrobacterium deltaense]|uniref:hypothetical protein n=1 Tax=Agrobacterium TaxID=357 RepID=UPI0007459D66|nr:MULTISPECIES: hypothetical protein [Agrobacterium]KVK53738.1 hypothetical protein L901_03225 [Agrobacterium sp. D14]RKF38034.1 hypothetical protein BCY90_04750 [Agrobacterium deltaense]
MSIFKAAVFVTAVVILPATSAGAVKPQIVNAKNAAVHTDFKSRPYLTDPTRIFYCELEYSAYWDEGEFEYRLAFTYGLRFPPVTERQVPIHFLSSFLSKTDSKGVETVIPVKKAYVGTSDDNTLAKEIRSHEPAGHSAFTRFDNPSVFGMTSEMSDDSRLYTYVLTATDKIIVAEMDFSATETGMPGDATQAQSFAKCAERVIYQSVDKY